MATGAHRRALWERIKRDRYLYFLIMPGIVYFIVFAYVPMYGALIAFQDYNPGRGVLGSDWVGLENFIMFFESPYFARLVSNTVLISLYSLLFGFPIPILSRCF